jgi:hypothetical protein
MTTPEYQAAIERLTASRAALLEYEDLAMELARQPQAQSVKGLILAFRAQIHATRLLVLEVGEGVRRAAVQVEARGGWGHE